MALKRIAVLGSTGSVGTQALDVVARFPDRFRVVGLVAGRGGERLVDQVRAFMPERVAVRDERAAAELRGALGRSIACEIRAGVEGAEWVAAMEGSDFVLSAISGGAGMRPTAAALAKGKNVGLANKESMVLAGELLSGLARRTGAALLPVDSEHSAIFQCLSGQRREDVRRLVLTASGGPFWAKPREAFERATRAEALRHPNWSMGEKITIDSATLMNKALEIIEARWLFDLPPEQIGVVVHPQSVVHSMVEFNDGSLLAQLGVSDMRGPIAYALGHPERLPLDLPPLDLAARAQLTFAAPDEERFPATALAYRALARGGTAPAAMSGADEAAVAAFLTGEIPLPAVTEIVGRVLEEHVPRPVASVEIAWEASEGGRRRAEQLVVETRPRRVARA
ncbi:MAG TPA: 1-deoxy-D-xylulose-5-phosphate reductoisomerase [Myxococcales bacterium]|nr:1-deoxy-D-xylulose-5-phosphate reductoisomerase [Myxococcales bacterium]